MDHLVGQRLPNIELPSTDGTLVNPANLKGMAVYFCYPYTGKPGVADPPGWDGIPGAHGSTPQALMFSTLYDGFEKLAVKVFGLSFQDTAWQQEFVRRTALRVPLLSDHAKKFSQALALPTFKAGDNDYLKRLTLLANDGTIIGLRFLVASPENDAAETLRLFKNY